VCDRPGRQGPGGGVPADARHRHVDQGGPAVAGYRRDAHPAEFGLIFGTPIPGVDLYDENSPACIAGQRFGLVFAALFLQLWSVRPFAVPDLGELDPRLFPQLEAYRARLGVDLPVPVVYVFLSCWARIYGMVTMELFGHLTFALDDAEPIFMTELFQIGRLMGLTDILHELG